VVEFGSSSRGLNSGRDFIDSQDPPKTGRGLEQEQQIGNAFLPRIEPRKRKESQRTTLNIVHAGSFINLFERDDPAKAMVNISQEVGDQEGTSGLPEPPSQAHPKNRFETMQVDQDMGGPQSENFTSVFGRFEQARRSE